MRIVKYCLLVVLLFQLKEYDCAKILSIFPTSSKSHWIVGSKLMKTLAAKGHDVTVISPYPLKTPLKNYRDIEITGILDEMQAVKDQLLNFADLGIVAGIQLTYDFGFKITNLTLNNPNVQKLIQSNEKFDLIVLEIFLNDAMLGFGHHFDAPIIGMSTFGASKWTTDLIGTPSPPSYVPHPFLSFTDRMTFVERIGNTLMSCIEFGVVNYYDFPKQDALYEKIFTSPKPELSVLKKQAVSVILLNNHFSLSYPRPYVPNMIEVGGLHINRKPNPLPLDIKYALDNATDGAVYFSLGSNIESKSLPEAKRKIFLNVFARLKQKVLWKWEDETLPDQPKNVLIKKWWPQDDVLAHPNLKVFITHGGLLGTTESLFHGVPVIGIPFFGDQELNMAKAVKGGYGLTIPYKDISEEYLYNALTKILSDQSFGENSQKVSKRFRDQPLNPLETAVFWVEYVLRHDGAPHLHSAAQELSFIQYHNLDVLATLILLPILFLYLVCLMICGRKSRLPKENKQETKKKKK